MLDLKQKSIAELLLLKGQVDSEIRRRKKEELAEEQQPKAGKTYVNPDNQFQTWSGRGRPPRWLERAKELERQRQKGGGNG